MKFNWTQVAIAFGLFLLGYMTFNNPWFKSKEEKPAAAPASVSAPAAGSASGAASAPANAGAPAAPASR